MYQLRLLALACAAGAVMLATACGAPAGSAGDPAGTISGSTTGGTSPTADPEASGPGRIAAPTVTVTRSGGIAGVRQSVEIVFDGSWTYTDEKSGASERGSLTAAQRTELLRLVSDPAFLAELSQTPSTSGCADAFSYSIKVGQDTATASDCGLPGTSLTASVLKLIADATAF
jgi:hypothetical protein